MSESIPIAQTNQRFAMVSTPVAIGNAVATIRVIWHFAKSGSAICEAAIGVETGVGSDQKPNTCSQR